MQTGRSFWLGATALKDPAAQLQPPPLPEKMDSAAAFLPAVLGELCELQLYEGHLQNHPEEPPAFLTCGNCVQ